MSQKRKARLVVLGFEDPKLLEVARDAPTMSKESRTQVIQYVASKKWRLINFDITTAFLRGEGDGRFLAMECPPELREALGLSEDEVAEILGGVYGRVDAPLLFFKSFTKLALSLGFVKHPFDPCVFSSLAWSTSTILRLRLEA